MSTEGCPSAPTQPRYIPDVLKGMAKLPRRSTAMRPPVPPIFPTFSSTSRAAASTERPPYCIDAETSWATTERMKYSPSPVQETAQVSLLAYVDRKSTRLNSSHEWISYAVFC